MRFYSLKQSYNDSNINFLQLESLHILIGVPLTLSYLSHVLPNYGTFIADEKLYDTTKLKKQHSMKNSTSTGMLIEEEINEYYMEIQGKKFIRKEAKFDLSSFDNIDLAQIDVILINNLDNLLALPYITEYSKFKGKILTTFPIAQLGCFIVKNFHEMVEMRNKTNFIVNNDLFEESKFFELFEGEGLNVSDWLDIYTLKEIESSFSKLTVLNFNEIHQLDENVSITGISSGYSLGSSNWVFQTKTKKVGYLSNSSLSTHRHPSAFDFASMQNADILIIEDIVNKVNIDFSKPIHTPGITNTDILASNFVEALTSHLRKNTSSHILIPVSNALFFLDFIDLFRVRVSNFIKIHIIGCCFEEIIGYANANVEFVNKIVQDKIYSTDPEVPFNAKELFRLNKLAFYSTIDEFQQRNQNYSHEVLDSGGPSIYIVGHPSFRVGYSAKFLEIFEKITSGTPLLLLIDPFMQDMDWVQPFSFQKIQTARCPLDSNLIFSELGSVIKQINPGTIIVPKSYKTNQNENENFFLKVDSHVKRFEYAEDHEIVIDFPAKSIQAGGYFENKTFKDMNKFELPPMKMYFVEGDLEKNTNGEYTVKIRESGKNPEGRTYLLWLEKSEIAYVNLLKEMEALGFKVIKSVKPTKTKENGVTFKVVLNKGEQYCIIFHSLQETKIYFSKNFSNEEIEQTEKRIITGLNLTKIK